MNPLKSKRPPRPKTPSAPAALRKLVPTSERTFSIQSQP